METKKETEPRSLAALAREALAVQDACNMSGVVFGFARAMADLCVHANRLGHGTDWKNHHPIVRLWCDKLQDLSGGNCIAAIRECKELAKGE